MSTPGQPSPAPAKRFQFGMRTAIMELFDIGPWVAITVLSIVLVLLIIGVVFFVRSAPPSQITLASGPEGSMFHRTAVRYQKALEASGVKVNIVNSTGSMDNLDRITQAKTKVDIALVQSGIIDDEHDLSNIVSLGAIANQPVFFFYRGDEIDQLVDAKGKAIAIGNEGSGTRKIALKLLDLNGIKESSPGTTQLLGLDTDDAVKALFDKKIDAAFIMSENVALDDLRKLMRSTDIRLMNFKRNAAAYVRKVDYLNMLVLPEGVIDFGLNIPQHDVSLVGPMVELIATKDLHPALSDLILDAAMTVHARPGLFQKRGEFPIPIEQTIKISDDADRFYKSGKTLLYRHLPFTLASLINRILFVLIPLLVVLIPVVRIIPWIFRWKNLMRIRRLYRALMQIEEEFKQETNPQKIADLHKKFDRIDNTIRTMRVRPAFAEQFYHLRGHIDYVRRIMDRKSV